MRRIAITGGIGSGKSSICKIFEWCSVPIFNTDEQTKLLYKDRDIKEQVIKLLGEESYNGYDTIDKKFIATKIFTDDNLKTQLTQGILYPHLWMRIDKWCSHQK